MAKYPVKDCDCASELAPSCCRVEAIVNIDERGQMVLPKDVREKAGLGPKDKLAVVTYGEGESCCITLVKVDRLSQVVRDVLGPDVTRAFAGGE